ncbi:MAG: phytanoyl-CoA dioxygenase family protein [Actinomycetota bacterium]|nr:phytanoyl-CoA dioxygenase family protein [Actinomycetota bacterium]
MFTFRRRERGGGAGGSALAEQLSQEFSGSDAELFAEIERLTQANRLRPSHATEQRLLHLRNLAGIRRLADVGSDPRHPEPDFAALPAAEGLPEVAADAVTPALLRAAILRHGCLLVRGLVPRSPAVRFARRIDRCFQERERHDAGQKFDAGYYCGFDPDPSVGGEMSRHWIKSGGGVLAVDSPRLSFEMLEMFQSAGLPALVQGYLGEPPLITAQKTTLRKADPGLAGAWHQDGKFMGQVRALNLWLALSRCGDEAPGLDVVPRRIDHHVTTQTDEAWLDNMVSQRMAEEAAAGTGILRPIFEPGDALLFDELFLHKTGSDPSMPKPRFAIENWFFGASGYPAEYAPLAV